MESMERVSDISTGVFHLREEASEACKCVGDQRPVGLCGLGLVRCAGNADKLVEVFFEPKHDVFQTPALTEILKCQCAST